MYLLLESIRCLLCFWILQYKVITRSSALGESGYIQWEVWKVMNEEVEEGGRHDRALKDYNCKFSIFIWNFGFEFGLLYPRGNLRAIFYHYCAWLH